MNAVLLQRALLVLALLCQTLPALAASEHELRVAMIYNIARFVQWPRSALVGSEFNLCALGTNTVADALPRLQGKPLGEQSINVHQVKRDADLAGCNLVYIAPEEALRLAVIDAALTTHQSAALTISDAPSFLALGGMVQLLTLDNRQRFRINQQAAANSRLNINAKLLQLALPPEHR